MELIFIRHGQGQHNLDVPDRLNIENPHLTDKGRNQVSHLRSIFTFVQKDLFIASPTIRTIETTNILTSLLIHPQKFISPLVGPRMFPFPENPHNYHSKCDNNYPLEQIQKDHTDYILMDQDNSRLWSQGVNTMEIDKFSTLGESMIQWLKSQCAERIFIIAHDGTITNYRQLLGETGLTRSNFLGEAGWYRLVL